MNMTSLDYFSSSNVNIDNLEPFNITERYDFRGWDYSRCFWPVTLMAIEHAECFALCLNAIHEIKSIKRIFSGEWYGTANSRRQDLSAGMLAGFWHVVST